MRSSGEDLKKSHYEAGYKWGNLLYKNGSIMILDEPTAALDPIAERNQYLQYETICKNKKCEVPSLCTYLSLEGGKNC